MNKASKRQARYDRQNVTGIYMKLHNINDADILDWLNKQPSKQGAIKEAVRLMINEEGK